MAHHVTISTVTPSVAHTANTYDKLIGSALATDDREMWLVTLRDYLILVSKSEVGSKGSVGCTTAGVTSQGQRVVVKRQLVDGLRRPDMSDEKLAKRLPPITREALFNEMDCANLGPEAGRPLRCIFYGKADNQHDKSFLVFPFLEFSLEDAYAEARARDAAALEDVAQQLVNQLVDMRAHLAHRDVKIENVRCHEGRLILIDYGSALKNTTHEDPEDVLPQNQFHNPPQAACLNLVVQDPHKVDVWQLGILLVTLEKLHPFPETILPTPSTDEQRMRAFRALEETRMGRALAGEEAAWQEALDQFWQRARALPAQLGELLDGMLAYEEEDRWDLDRCKLWLDARPLRQPTPWRRGTNHDVKLDFEHAWKALEKVTGVMYAPTAEAHDFDEHFEVRTRWAGDKLRPPLVRRQSSVLAAITVSPRQQTLAYAVCIGILGAAMFAGCVMTPIFFFVPFAAAPLAFWGAAAASLFVGSGIAYRTGRT